jgi:hypothetical protein
MEKTMGNGARAVFSALVIVVFLLGSLAMTALQADENGTGAEDAAAETAQSEENAAQMEGTRLDAGIGGNDQDPEVMLTSIQTRRTQRDALFGASPLKPLHDDADAWHDRLYKKTNVRLGTSIHHLFQWLSESHPGTDDWGTATDMDIIGTWEATNRGEPHHAPRSTVGLGDHRADGPGWFFIGHVAEHR